MRLRAVRNVVFVALAVFSAGADAPRAQSPARSGAGAGAPPVLEWPAPTPTARPWTRWWWHGSSVTRDGLTAAMAAYRAAGLGGLELTPIYGVRGEEDRFVPYLSPAWMALLDHTMAEATRLGLGLDMATGTGWPFGGPWVGRDEASRNLVVRKFTVAGGARLEEPVVARQEPVVRAVGRMVYDLRGSILGPASDDGKPQPPPPRPRSPAIARSPSKT